MFTEDVGGSTSIARVLEKLRGVSNINDVIILTDDATRPALANLGAEIHETSHSEPEMVRRARLLRKFTPAAKRSGLLGASQFSEEGSPRAWKDISEKWGTDAMLIVSAHAPLIDARLIEKLVGEFVSRRYSQGLMILNAAPGLGAMIFSRELIDVQAETNSVAAESLKLDVTDPQGEPELAGIFLSVPVEVTRVAERLLTDTPRGIDLVREILRRNPQPTAMDIAKILRDDPYLSSRRFPRHLVIEPTFDAESYAIYNPVKRGEGRGVRGESDFDLQFVEKLAPLFQEAQDVCVTLGRFGEPLRHPQIFEIIGKLRDVGAFGIHLRTDGSLLTEAAARRIVELEIDAVSISIDALTPETYKEVWERDALQEVLCNVQKLAEIKAAAGAFAPVIVPGFTKMRCNLDEMEEFYVYYASSGYPVNIRAQHAFGGAISDMNPLRLNIAPREACRRLVDELYILPSGDVSQCVMDFSGGNILGNLHDQRIEQIWAGEKLNAVRDSHCRGNFAEYNLPAICAACTAFDGS
ncbi:MAG: SPASM domain-containing protein [Planctomycetes bacterium]|nr:SPASM domain-containing protein [Planctomycetota bacterium]